MWADGAALNGGFLGAKSRDITAERMTPSQIETAQKLVRESVRKKYKECWVTTLLLEGWR